MQPDVTRESIPPMPKWPTATTSVFAWAQPKPVSAQEVQATSADSQVLAQARAQQQQLEQELAAARAELAAMHELLEEIPQIFEHKFQQRIQPILEDNASLRTQLLQLQGTPASGRQLQLPPARTTPPRIRKALRHAFGLQGTGPNGGEDDPRTQAA